MVKNKKKEEEEKNILHAYFYAIFKKYTVPSDYARQHHEIK